MNWFRLYHGTSTDPKLHKASRAAKVSRGLFLGAWVAVLEYASQQEPRGGVDGLDADTLAFLIDSPPAVAARILAALAACGMIGNGVVLAWERRQRASDDVAPRVRKHREQARDTTDGPAGSPAKLLNGQGPAGSGNVTETRRAEQSRTDKKETLAAAPSPATRAPAREEAAAAGPAPPVVELPTDLLEEAARRTGVPDAAARALFGELVEMAGTVPLAGAALRKGLDRGDKPWSYAAGAARGFRADAQRGPSPVGVTLADTMALMAKYRQMEQTDADQPPAYPALLN